MSAVKLKHGFRTLFGTGVYSLFQQYRMERAMHELQSTRSSVTDIALSLGYSNPSQFSSAFRKHFGVLPRDVARQRR